RRAVGAGDAGNVEDDVGGAPRSARARRRDDRVPAERQRGVDHRPGAGADRVAISVAGRSDPNVRIARNAETMREPLRFTSNPSSPNAFAYSPKCRMSSLTARPSGPSTRLTPRIARARAPASQRWPIP